MNNSTAHEIIYEFIRVSSGETLEEMRLSTTIEDQNGILNARMQEIADDLKIEIGELAWRALGRH